MKLFLVLLALMIGVVISATLTIPLEVYVIKDVAQLYQIDYLVSMPKEVMFGSLLILGLVTTKLKRKDLKNDDDGEDSEITKFLKNVFFPFVFMLGVLMFWGAAYIVHNINF